MSLSGSLTRVLKARFEAPRFGHSRTFSDLFSPYREVSKNYLMGVFIVGILLLVLFCFWLAVLLLFKYCAPVKKRVGFLSGKPFQALRDDGTVNPWITRGRILFAISCVLCIIFSILLVTAGIGNVNTTSSTIGNGAEMGYNYFTNAQLALISTYKQIAYVHQLRKKAQEQLELFWTTLVTTIKEADDVDLEKTAESLQNLMIGLKDFARENIATVNSTLAQGQETCENVITITESIEVTGIQWLVGVTMSIIPAMVLGCLYWTMYGKNDHRMDKCRTWFIFPLFILMIMLSIILSSVLVIAGTMNSDFCEGEQIGFESITGLSGPDSTVLRIMMEKGTNPRSLQFRFAAYVISKCDLTPFVQERPLIDMENLENQVRLTLDEIVTFIDTAMASNETQWAGYNLTALEEVLHDLEGPLQELWGFILEFLEVFACAPLYAIYYEVAHLATCSEAYTGVYWIFVSLQLISVFGLLAITFRSALYPLATAESFDWDLELLEKQAENTGGEINGMESAIPQDGKDNEQLLNGLAVGAATGLAIHEDENATRLPDGQSQPTSFDDTANSTMCTGDEQSGGIQDVGDSLEKPAANEDQLQGGNLLIPETDANDQPQQQNIDGAGISVDEQIPDVRSENPPTSFSEQQLQDNLCAEGNAREVDSLESAISTHDESQQTPNTRLGNDAAAAEVDDKVGAFVDDDGDVFHSVIQPRLHGDEFASMVEPNLELDDSGLPSVVVPNDDEGGGDVFHHSQQPNDEVDGGLTHSGGRGSAPVDHDTDVFHSVIQHKDEVSDDNDVFHSVVRRDDAVDREDEILSSTC